MNSRPPRVCLLVICVLLGGVRAAAQDPCARLPSSLGIAAELRQLPFRREVGCLALPGPAFEQLFRARVEAQIDLPKLNAEGAVYRLLGFMPEGFDYAGCIVQSYLSDTGAFFRSEQNDFVFKREAPLPMALALHELVHALQSQNLALQTLTDIKNESSDALLAKFALVEGDASAVEHEAGDLGVFWDPAGAERRRADAAQSRCDLPEQIERLLSFPYEEGTKFVRAIKAQGGWAAVNAAFALPPQSSAEVLHPDRYFRRKQTGKALSFELALVSKLDGQVPVFSDRMGEFFMRTYLGLFLPQQRAAEVAAGWSDDRLILLNGARHDSALYWESAWGSEAAAQTFYQAFMDLLVRRLDLPQLRSAALSCRIQNRDSETIEISRRARQVQIVITSSR